MRRLPLAYACDRRWNELDGDGIVRHCHDCDRDVVDLSALDEDSARAMLDEKPAACVRYHHERGRIVFAKKARGLAVAAAAAVLLAGGAAGADTSTPTPPAPSGAPAPAAPRHKHEKKRSHPPPAAIKDDDGEAMGQLISKIRF